MVEGGVFGGDGLPAGMDGVVGLGLLTQFRFTLDVPAGRLTMVPLAGHDMGFWDELKGAVYPLDGTPPKVPETAGRARGQPVQTPDGPTGGPTGGPKGGDGR